MKTKTEKKYIIRKWKNLEDAEAEIEAYVENGWVPYLMAGDGNYGGVLVMFRNASRD